MNDYMEYSSVYPLSTELPQYTFLTNLYLMLARYAWVAPVVLGLPGNVLAMFVANRKHNRAISQCIYITGMAIVDTIQLLVIAHGRPILYSEGGQKLMPKGRDVFYKYYSYMIFTCAMASGLFLASMSIDRLFAVRFPMAASRLCTTSRAKKIVCIITVFVIIFNLQMPFVLVYIKHPLTGSEIMIIEVKGFEELEIIASMGQLVLGTAIPFMIIFGCNIIIIVTVRRASSTRATMSKGQGQDKRKDEQYLTRMLIFVSLAYFVTSFPFRLFHLLMDIPAIGDTYDMNDPYWNLRYLVAIICIHDVWVFNYAINFYMYCIGGGVKYRKDAFEVLKHPCGYCSKG